MSKLRVHDMAGEFGIAADEVIGMLRSMDVPVRSHLTVLTDDQVARVRARWEREKRARQEKPVAAPAATRRRKGAPATTTTPAPVAPEPAAATPPPAVDAAAAAKAGVRRRRAADVAAAAEALELAAEETAAAAAASAAAAAAAAAVVEAPSAPVEVAAPVRETTAPAAPEPGDDVAHAPAATEHEGASEDVPAVEPVRAVEPPPPPPPAPPAPPAAPIPQPQTYSTGPSIPDRPRPRPVVPGAPRPRPGQGGGGFERPRPVASASPSGSVGLPPRRDDQQRKPGGAPGGGGGGGGPSGASQSQQQQRGKKKGKRGAVDQEEVSANISRVMGAMRGGVAKRGGSRRDDGREEMEAIRREEAERGKKTVRVNEFITVGELAEILKLSASQIVAFAFKNLGLMVTINQRLDFDQIELIAGEFGFQAVREEEYAADMGEERVADRPEDLVFRPPVVTIMGHVDHGKTSLLDYIRKANVVAGEAGGITQHIGAYHVTLPNSKHITFLDTPGHEAFTAMRARGAQVTDIVVLVVAADDAVMPQTIEAISHAKNAGVPMIVAINKVDLPDANPMRVKQDLLQHGVVLEEFGGTTLSTEVSAKKGTNVPELLEQVLLQSEVLDLKSNPDKKAHGSVVEAQLDPGKGPVATILVSSGTLHVGDDFICGLHSGRVRAMLDERGKPVKSAGPAIPVQVLGLTGVPMAGDQFVVVEDASQAREIAQRRERLDREAKSRRTSKGVVSLEDFMSQAAAGQKRTLNLIIKADQGGPAEALADALQKLSNNEVQVDVVHRGVGAITEGDILLARTSGAIIIGFHVRPDNNARTAAEREGVDIKLYRIIYEAVADVRAALEGMLRPEEREVVMGEAEVREIFKVSRIGTIAGCSVRSGIITKAGRVRLIRDAVEVYDGTLSSLRRFKDDVKEVKEGYECGIGLENFNDLKVGDVIECYKTEEVARTLQPESAGA
ncbi:MAG: translation initiation factor IF-2 [Gemmatimonadetes bacterium]|nr:translation initiation factor IF-2 [Gemmatimonadota bacterium]